MILDLNIFRPALDKVKLSKVVFISGILTFLYIVELSIGARTVYHAFKIWNDPPAGLPEYKTVSWTLCIACLFTASISSFVVNLFSALWEQKQLKEMGSEKSAIRFAGHLVAGGMIWRYVLLWFSDDKEIQLKQTVLLTMTKFFHTQFFTIPLIIVHASLLEDINEIIYIMSSVICISLNMILTCVVFSCCKSVVGDLKKWNYETVNLVPLIFTQSILNEQNTAENANNSESVDKQIEQVEGTPKENSKTMNEAVELNLVRLAIFFQTFCFSLGRLLALGILLKLAGIYAVSIMFLQLLVSVIYLKFQVPFLVSDTLPKWRQLTRLAFMSYILIFEWHLNRDSSSGYDFNCNIKHTVLYYSIATFESVFYLVTWAITTSYLSDGSFDMLPKTDTNFIRNTLLIGILSLVISLLTHLLIILWQSRRISTFVSSARRRYASARLKLSIRKNSGVQPKSDGSHKRNLEISYPIPMDNPSTDPTSINSSETEKSDLEKHNSYQDLREPIDEDIELYSKENKSKEKSASPVNVATKNIKIANDKKDKSISPKIIKESLVKSARFRSFNFKKSSPHHAKEIDIENNNKNSSDETEVKITSKAEINKKSPSSSIKNSKNKKNNVIPVTTDKVPQNENAIAKTKTAIFSETFNTQLNKLSNASQKLTVTVSEQLQNCKKQFNTFQFSMFGKSSENEQNRKSKTQKDIDNETPKQFIGDIYSAGTEGYFIGDERCCDEVIKRHDGDEVIDKQENVDIEHDEDGDGSDALPPSETEDSEADINDESQHNCSLEAEDSDQINKSDDSDLPSIDHCEGDEPCPCFICRTNDNRFSRRRSSSMPPGDRRHSLSVDGVDGASSMTRFPSSPNILSSDADLDSNIKSDDDSIDINKQHSPGGYPKKFFHTLSLMAPVDREEHFV